MSLEVSSVESGIGENGARHWQEWLTFIVRLFFFFPSPGKQPTPCIFPATSDSKTDSKTGGQL